MCCHSLRKTTLWQLHYSPVETMWTCHQIQKKNESRGLREKNASNWSLFMINVCNIHAPRLGLWTEATRILIVHCVRLLIDESSPPDHHILTFWVGGGHIHQSKASVFGDLSVELNNPTLCIFKWILQCIPLWYPTAHSYSTHFTRF